MLSEYETRLTWLISFEKREGKSLYDFYNEKNALSLKEARLIVAQIVLGIEYLHSKEIIHGTLSVENILIGNNCKIKIMMDSTKMLFSNECNSDLNLSKYHQSWAMRTPPEVLLKKEITKETDFYALGIITYELTTGQLPFNEKDIYSIHKKILKSEPLSFFKIISFHDEDDFLDDDVNNSEEDVKNWEDFIYSLICLNQKKRLGVKGFDKIKQHPFLNSINFHQLQTQEY